MTMEANGRVVVPAAVRSKLGISGRQLLSVETENGAITLTPVAAVPVDRTFPITAELVASVQRADAEPGYRISRSAFRDRLAQAAATSRAQTGN